MKLFRFLFVALLLQIPAAAFTVSVAHAPEARSGGATFFPRGFVAGSLPDPGTPGCPMGEVDAATDGCHDALPTGFIDANLITANVLDASGNPVTIVHPITYNAAGVYIPSGPPTGSVYIDPAQMSCYGTAVINHTHVQWVSITNAGTCASGMHVWIQPSSGSALLNDDPIIQSCVTTTPGVLFDCTMDKDEGTHGGGTYMASYARGCTWLKATGTVSAWTCDFRNAAVNASAIFSVVGNGMEWGPVGGHTASIMRVTGAGSVSGNQAFFRCRYCHWGMDQYENGQAIISFSLGIGPVSWDLSWNDMDGGNDLIPVGSGSAAFVANGTNKQTSIINASGDAGEAGGGVAKAITETFAFNRVHGWAGNPVSMSHTNAIVTMRNNVYTINGENNDNCNLCDPNMTLLHGSLLSQWQNTIFKAHLYQCNVFNNTVVMRHGYRAGQTTALSAMLSGHGTDMIVDDCYFANNTFVVNYGSTGASASEDMLRFFQMGKLTSVRMHRNRFYNAGVTTCFELLSDLQYQQTAFHLSSVADTPNNRSTATFSGGASGVDVWMEGQYLWHSRGSQLPRFTATMAANGDGTTSHLHITLPWTNGTPFTLAAGTEIHALRAHDPILIISGSNQDYEVTTNQTLTGDFRTGYLILPPLTDGTTAACTSFSTCNGTFRLEGLYSNSSNDNSFSTWMYPGNRYTIDADTDDDNYEMTVAGSAGKVSWDGGCPNTHA